MTGADFEDNVQIACAEAVGLVAVVTRDQGSFAGSPLPIWLPAQCLSHLPPRS